jgi:hypothetical protein
MSLSVRKNDGTFFLITLDLIVALFLKAERLFFVFVLLAKAYSSVPTIKASDFFAHFLRLSHESRFPDGKIRAIYGVHSLFLEHFQEKCETVFRPEMR